MTVDTRIASPLHPTIYFWFFYPFIASGFFQSKYSSPVTEPPPPVLVIACTRVFPFPRLAGPTSGTRRSGTGPPGWPGPSPAPWSSSSCGQGLPESRGHPTPPVREERGKEERREEAPSWAEPAAIDRHDLTMTQPFVTLERTSFPPYGG